MGVISHVAQTQVAFFFGARQFGNRVHLLNTLSPALKGDFDDIVSFPIPDDAPAEIPRVRLRNTANADVFQISPARADCLFSGYANENPQKLVDRVLQLSKKIFNILESEVKTTMNRLGFAALMKCSLVDGAQPAVEHLMRKYCSEEARKELNDQVDAFSIHAMKRWSLSSSSLRLNRWVRIDSARTASTQAPVNEFVVLVDVNTWAEEAPNRQYSVADLESFLRQAWTEVEEVRSNSLAIRE